MAKVSIVIPVYNVEKYLRECLDSILNQSLRDIEVICVDDGSKDNSLKILEEYSQKDSRLSVIIQKNQGAGAARNIGLERATGEYVLFFDSDDYILEGALEKLYNHAQSKNADITICRSFKCFEQEKDLQEISYSVKTKLLDGKTDFSPKDIADNIYQFCVGWPWDKLYKLSFVKENKLEFQNLRHSNDTFFVLFSLALAEKISILEENLIVHRYHNKSLAATRIKAPDCFYFALLKLLESLKNRNLYESFEKSFVNYCVTFPFWHFETIKDNNAKKIMFERIIDILTRIDFDKYPSDYFYSKMEYEEIKRLWNFKFYSRYRRKEFLNSIFSLINSKDKSHKILSILGLRFQFKRRVK
jgi:glycosyltransferase involved in cell wall biosynthesis